MHRRQRFTWVRWFSKGHIGSVFLSIQSTPFRNHLAHKSPALGVEVRVGWVHGNACRKRTNWLPSCEYCYESTTQAPYGSEYCVFCSLRYLQSTTGQAQHLLDICQSTCAGWCTHQHVICALTQNVNKFWNTAMCALARKVCLCLMGQPDFVQLNISHWIHRNKKCWRCNGWCQNGGYPCGRRTMSKGRLCNENQ